MDGERNLQRNLFNGSKLRRTVSLQYVFPSFQNQQRNLLHRSQSNPDFSDKNTRVYDDNINYSVGLFTLSIYEELSSKQKEDKEAQNEKVYEAKGVFTQTPKPDHKLDKHPITYKPRGDVPDIYKRLLESQSQTDNRSIIRSINSGKTQSQKTYGFLDSGQYIIVCATKQQLKAIHFPLHILPRNQDLEVMARRERWDHANCLEMNAWTHLSQVRPNIPIRTLTIDVADGTAKENLAKTFGITKIFPLYLDRSEYIM
ncbi:hypothetical protein RhiirC2_782179 [Rhizophagus irregularis]|uniref:Uncharacterized protein n=1 Tax=Rhizophagus irregularis TaxID=588596 RepID=A0A2N1N3N3_9GLOM|nr:hypothetical protein RhiirC2_782179 [Rhizophagus irregularis]